MADDDNDPYELAEDPEAPVRPARPAAPDPRLSPAASEARGSAQGPPAVRTTTSKDPPLDGRAGADSAAKDSPRPGAGGAGAASHFSGEDPAYINPEVARLRREDQRRARAEEEAAEAAARNKQRMAIAGVVLALLAIAWFLFLR